MSRTLGALLVGLLLAPTAVSAAVPGAERVELLVMFEEHTGAATRARLHGLTGASVIGRLPEVNVDHITVPFSAISVYEGAPGVVAVEEPRTYRVMGRPNDPLVPEQWGLRKLDAFKAWKIEDAKKSGVTVAVLDTGVDGTHVDLEGRVLEGFDYLELDENTYDDNGHGTHVAGIIAANVGNRTGVAGLAPGTSIIPMKVCEAMGTCSLPAILAGAVDSTRRGADVINMSLGGAGQCSVIEQAVFDWIWGQGTVVVASAGNHAEDGNPPVAPANCDHTIGVGATDPKNKKAAFSSFGGWVDIAAPGVDIWSTMPPLVTITSTHIGYASASGTSMAAPFVAAAASLVKARHPEWTPDRIERKLLSTAKDLGPKGRDDKFGRGLLNLVGALR